MTIFDAYILFEKLHEMSNRATPEKMLLYRHALLLYKIYNSEDHSLEWIALNFQQRLSSCQSYFEIAKTKR